MFQSFVFGEDGVPLCFLLHVFGSASVGVRLDFRGLAICRTLSLSWWWPTNKVPTPNGTLVLPCECRE